MNKPMQILESSSVIFPDSAGVVNNGRGKDGEGSFSRILSRSTDAPNGKETGQSLPISGKKLPEQQAGIESRQQAGAAANPDENEEPLPAAVLDLQERLAGQAVQQPSLVPELSLNEETAVAESPLTADAPATAGGEEQQVQLQGQVVDSRLLAKMAPDNLSVVEDRLQQDIVDDVAGARRLNASNQLTAGAARASTDAEPVANVVREAVQTAMASQASSGDLKQFMQQNGNNPDASKLLTASSSAATNAVPFLQTLSESVLTVPSARVPLPVGQPGWGEAVGQQVTWFVSQNISAASLRLNPQHLGPMELAISMDGDQASISFTSQQAMVRDALESSIPRLREMLSENGLNLVNVSVSQQGKSHGDGQGAPASRQGPGAENDGSGAGESLSGPDMPRMVLQTQGLVDFYA